MNKPKILIYDLETSPIETRRWSVWYKGALEITKDMEITSIAYKWHGEKKIHVLARCDFKDKTDKTLTKKLFKLIDEADAVMGHNAGRFDNKVSQTRFLFHKLGRPSPYYTIDTLKIAKKHFALTRNNLDEIARFLGVTRKLSVGAKDLWKACEEGDKKAWKLLKDYNVNDVLVLYEVFEKLEAWSDIPSEFKATNADKPRVCTSLNCDSTEFRNKGYTYTLKGVYKRFVCKKCGKPHRERRKDPQHHLNEIVGE